MVLLVKTGNVAPSLFPLPLLLSQLSFYHACPSMMLSFATLPKQQDRALVVWIRGPKSFVPPSTLWISNTWSQLWKAVYLVWLLKYDNSVAMHSGDLQRMGWRGVKWEHGSVESRRQKKESLGLQGRVEWLWFTPTITYFIDNIKEDLTGSEHTVKMKCLKH